MKEIITEYLEVVLELLTMSVLINGFIKIVGMVIN